VRFILEVFATALVQLWAEWLPSGVLTAGAREWLAAADRKEPVTMARLAEFLEPEPFTSLFGGIREELAGVAGLVVRPH
jgi:hypothetical protein